MMAPVFLLLLAAVSVFAEDYDYADRIIGGDPTVIDELPFLVGLLYTRRSEGTRVKNALCGGTIITDIWVLTSAYCVGPDTIKLASGKKVRLTHVRAGSSYSDKGGVLREVERVLSHKNPPNDIGLVKVDKPWPFNGFTISVARLPRQGDPIPVGSMATIMGWGSTDQEGTPAEILMMMEALVISVEACNDRFKAWSDNKYGISDLRICTLSDPVKLPKSVYRNDPGSPVVVDDEVAGIVSWFEDKMPDVVPNVHTRVSLYIDWIEENVGALPRSE